MDVRSTDTRSDGRGGPGERAGADRVLAVACERCRAILARTLGDHVARYWHAPGHCAFNDDGSRRPRHHTASAAVYDLTDAKLDAHDLASGPDTAGPVLY